MMDKIQCTLTVFFEAPFWVGVFEKIEQGHLSATKITFGSEPKDEDVYKIILNDFYQLAFSPAIDILVKGKKKNPKKAQRDAKRQLEQNGVCSKSHEALRLQREEFKLQKKEKSRKMKQQQKLLQFELKQKKKKAKHRGR